jgi:excisionase family DNA binding protein
MEDLLTTKELQELLKVDRTTVYRMLKDGRLTGIKIGEQWRFSMEEVKSLLAGPSSVEAKPAATAASGSVLPLHCVQRIQNVFAEIAEIGVVTVAATGKPLTAISHPSRFSELIWASEAGRQGCIASWAKLAEQPGAAPQFMTCHTGLKYAGARIEINGRLEAILIAGQFYLEAPETIEEAARLKRLAKAYDIDPQALAEAAREITVLDEHKRSHLTSWLQSVAHTFEEIGQERAEMLGRLRRIAEMSTLQPA